MLRYYHTNRYPVGTCEQESLVVNYNQRYSWWLIRHIRLTRGCGNLKDSQCRMRLSQIAHKHVDAVLKAKNTKMAIQ